MIKNLIFGLLFLFLSSSCQRINDYYSDINDSSIEHVKINDIKGLELTISSIKQDEHLVVTFYVKLLNSTIDLEDISISIIGLENPISEKKEFYKESGERFDFYEFKEIRKYINGQIETYTPIYYYFDDPRVIHIDDLNFNVLIKSNSGTITKQITMKRHSRYRLFLEGA